MKNIIENLCNGNIDERNREYVRTEIDEEETQAYETLKKTLNEEQVKLLEEYFEKVGALLAQQEDRYYERGFKTGVWLGLELSDFQPCHWKEE